MQPEPSDLLKANRYLLKIYSRGRETLAEAERRALVAALLAERYSSTAHYRLNAEADPDYWSKFSGRVDNRFAGQTYKGHFIPWIEGTGPDAENAG